MALRTGRAIPSLENGDHLSRAEFERRYAAMPELKKAELVEGVVYVASAVRYDAHAEPHAMLVGWLVVYAASTPGVGVADNATVRLDGENEPQPDALLRLEPTAGGRSRIDEDGYLTGAPELVAEVVSSSAAYDRHTKLRVYQRNGIQEYLLWLVEEARIEWYELVEGRYVLRASDPKGLLTSRVFPGLCLDGTALVSGEMARVLAALQQCLGTPEHRAFLARIQKAS